MTISNANKRFKDITCKLFNFQRHRFIPFPLFLNESNRKVENEKAEFCFFFSRVQQWLDLPIAYQNSIAGNCIKHISIWEETTRTKTTQVRHSNSQHLYLFLYVYWGGSYSAMKTLRRMNSLQLSGSPRWSQTKPRLRKSRAFISWISRSGTVPWKDTQGQTQALIEGVIILTHKRSREQQCIHTF